MSSPTISLAFNTAGIISLLVGFVLPNAVGYLTKASLNKGLKASILAGLAAVSAVLTQWLAALTDHTHFAWQASVLSAAATWLMAEGAYFKIWKPTGLSDWLQSMGVADDPSTTPTAPAAQDDEAGYVSRHAMSAKKVGTVQTASSPTVSPTDPATPAK